MQFSGFQMHRTTVGHVHGEALDLVYLDNHRPGPTLVLIHGLFDNKATWRDLCAHLQDHCRLVVPDLIGFGHSSKPLLSRYPVSQRYSPSMQVDLLGGFITGLNLDDLILGGSSLGGGLVLQLYLTRPDLAAKIRGLVLIDAAAYPQELPGHVRELGGWLGSLMNNPLCRFLAFRLGFVTWAVRRTFRHVFHHASKIPADLVDEAVSVLKTRDVFRSYQVSARNVLPPDHEALVERFSEVDCPTLILWGREDRIVPPLFALRFKEDIPHADVHVFDQCGHAPHLEYPEATAALIRGWVQEKLQPVSSE